MFWTRNPKRYVTRFWKFCTSRASRQLNLRKLGPTISKVYIFWKKISWGIEIWHQKWSRVKCKDFVTNYILIFEGQKIRNVQDPYFFNLSSYLWFHNIFELLRVEFWTQDQVFLFKFPFRKCITLGGFSSHNKNIWIQKYTNSEH